MISSINAVVQALVWTTLAVMMYVVWVNTRSDSGPQLTLSFHTQRVMQLLQALWMLLAVSLIITLLIFGLPRVSQASSAPSQGCIPPASAALGLSTDVAGAGNVVCSDSTIPGN